jgi:anti-sigma regulatory factor (Ser/Thr protein kinase)
MNRHGCHTNRGFHHEAFFYVDDDEYLAGTIPFLKEGAAKGEPTLVAVSEAKARLLKDHLNGEAEAIRFVNMAELGKNPARIIPAWREFAGLHLREDQPVRGIGEPIWPGRGPDELEECRRHESLLNFAFEDGPAWQLVCPYNASGALSDEVLEGARHNHPVLGSDGALTECSEYLGPAEAFDPLGGELADPGAPTDALDFDRDRVATLRRFVEGHARRAALSERRTADLVLAVSELASNSVRHAAGNGTLEVWQEGDTLFCEVRDEGHIQDPLVGRESPSLSQHSGRGLWLVNQVCDLVQLRSSPAGSAVRVRMSLS